MVAHTLIRAAISWARCCTVMKGRMGIDHNDGDSANISPTNLEVRKGRRIRVASTRLDGYITSM
jgi:hypothetical protein